MAGTSELASGLTESPAPGAPKHPITSEALPDELVAEIFTRYLPPYPSFPPWVGPGSPTHLLGVCRVWRAIALNTPSLWRAIHVESIDRKDIETAHLWLKRSGSSLLALQIVTVYHNPLASTATTARSPDTAAELSHPLVQELLANRWRWEYVDWDLSEPMIASFAAAPVPNLVHLSLGTVRRPPLAPRTQVLRLTECERLRAVNLWNVAVDNTSFAVGQLTTLTIINVDSCYQCMKVLEAARNLVECRLYIRPRALTRNRSFDFDSLDGYLVEVPRLETLVFEDITTPSQDWLARLVVPSLRRLAVSCELLDTRDVNDSAIASLWSGCRGMIGIRSTTSRVIRSRVG
uniref:F-box domain-containing protein n=1 Tax=Mycena chlorophos TaxID=658473 RepID=A0ABQ0LF50_MYCCL|nr:predicted protein [Mycena chlorophos]